MPGWGQKYLTKSKRYFQLVAMLVMLYVESILCSYSKNRQSDNFLFLQMGAALPWYRPTSYFLEYFRYSRVNGGYERHHSR